jgi:hypothetical protein
MDDELKGAWIYWPDSKTVTIVCNIYYENLSAVCFEEEEVTEVVKTNADLPPIPEIPRANAIPPIVNPNPPVIAKTVHWQDNPNSDAQDSSDAEPNEKRVRKPTKKIADLLGGNASLSTASESKLAPRV